MKSVIRKLSGVNMDIDLTTPQDQIEWEQDACPWNQADNSTQHQCAVKNISICKYFRGIEYLDLVLCSYPEQWSHDTLDPKFSIQGPSLGESNFCEPVLRSLPGWFGLEEANQHFLENIDQSPTFLALDKNEVIGFLALKMHYPKAAEIYVMGVQPDYHRQGLGRAMLLLSENHLRKQGVDYLQVKTLSDSHFDEGYAKTRAFYLAMGFSPLEEFKTLWDEANPALLLIKKL